MMQIKRLVDGDILIKVDCDLRPLSERKMFVATDEKGNPQHPEMVPIIVKIGRGQKLLEGILSGTYKTQEHAGQFLQLSSSTASRLIRMTFLSPYIIEKLVTGRLNTNTVMSQIDNLIKVPIWSEQHRMVGID